MKRLVDLSKTLLLSIIALLAGGLFAQIAGRHLPDWAAIISVTLVILIVVFAGAAILSRKNNFK
jgi:hypothetical protein